jgi:replication factor C subunit 2/4
MDAVLGQAPTVAFLKSRLTAPPHLILWGPTGVGKTMLANAWITEQLTAQGITEPAHHAALTLRLSSADDRGIAAIRQRLTEFVRRKKPKDGAVAWVLFDDAEKSNLPQVTQQALRRILELHTHQTRFIFITQSPDHIIEPIQSRCVILQLTPVPLHAHAAALATRHAPATRLPADSLSLMAGLALGNARQFTLFCQALPAGDVSTAELQLLTNAPPVTALLRLQSACARRDLPAVTEGVLNLWSRGYSFEDCIAMLETVVHVYNGILTAELQYVLQCCAEGHIAQILNRTTTLDLIAVLSGRAASTALA